MPAYGGQAIYLRKVNKAMGIKWPVVLNPYSNHADIIYLLMFFLFENITLMNKH
jgi:hypothetical protein